jgi:MFS transporter, DHA2 family, multidrug resistance protein
MSMLLTSMFNRSADVVAARRADSVLKEAARRGVMPDPSKLPHQVFAPDFTEHVTNDLSQAYAVVFAVAAILVATTLIPVRFLPKKPAGDPPT